MSTTHWLLLVGLGGLAAYTLFVIALMLGGRRDAARAVAGFIPDCLVLFRRLVGDGRVARRYKLLLLGVAAYLACPLDLVPDIIPIAGQLDDAIVAALALRVLLRASESALVEEHWPGPRSSLAMVMRLAGAPPTAAA